MFSRISTMFLFLGGIQAADILFSYNKECMNEFEDVQAELTQAMKKSHDKTAKKDTLKAFEEVNKLCKYKEHKGTGVMKCNAFKYNSLMAHGDKLRHQLEKREKAGAKNLHGLKKAVEKYYETMDQCNKGSLKGKQLTNLMDAVSDDSDDNEYHLQGFIDELNDELAGTEEELHNIRDRVSNIIQKALGRKGDKKHQLDKTDSNVPAKHRSHHPKFLDELDGLTELRALNLLTQTGYFTCQEYKSADMNDWHYVFLQAGDDNNSMTWNNKAGRKWDLTFDRFSGENLIFKVGTNCPYYKSGHTEAKLVMEGGQPKYITGPWGEKYAFDHYTSIQDFSLDYKLPLADVVTTPPQDLVWVNLENGSQSPQTYVRKMETVVTESSRFEHQAGVSIGVETTFSTSIPFVANGEVSMSMEASYQYTSGTENTDQRTVGEEVTVVVQPGEKIKLTLSAKQGTSTVPYTGSVRYYGWFDELMTFSGVYEGVNWSEVQVQYGSVQEE